MRYYNLNERQMKTLLKTVAKGYDEVKQGLDLAGRMHAAQSVTPGDIVQSTRSGDTYVIIDAPPIDGYVCAKRVAFGFEVQPSRFIGGFVRISGDRFVNGTMVLVGTLNDDDDACDCQREDRELAASRERP